MFLQAFRRAEPKLPIKRVNDTLLNKKSVVTIVTNKIGKRDHKFLVKFEGTMPRAKIGFPPNSVGVIKIHYVEWNVPINFLLVAVIARIEWSVSGVSCCGKNNSSLEKCLGIESSVRIKNLIEHHNVHLIISNLLIKIVIHFRFLQYLLQSNLSVLSIVLPL